jgi:tetratricopeptide (TPR) repeat protein
MSLHHRINRPALALILAAQSLCFVFPASTQVQPAPPANSRSTQKALTEAQKQMARGELADAETALWTVLTTNPNDEQALSLLATIRSRQQRYAEAEALLRRVLQINSNSVAAHRGLGETLIAENRDDDAIEEFKAAMELAPEDSEIRVEVAQLYAARGEYQQALSALEAIPKSRFPAAALPVKAASLLALGRSADTAVLVEEAKSSASAELDLAEVFVDAKLPDRALRCLELAAASLKRTPARLYYLRGRALQAKGQPEAATSSLRQALASDPKSADTLVAMSELQAGENQHADAVVTLQKALALNPNDVVVLRHLVVEAVKVRNGKVALSAASALAGRSVDKPDDLYLAGAAMLENNSSGASSAFEKYVALRDDNARAWLALGMAYVQQRRYADARGPLERSIKLDPSLAEAEYQLGVVAKNQGTSEEAAEHFQRAIALQPRNAKALWSLGNLYLLAGDLQRAQENLQAAEALEPNSVQTQYDLGLVLSKLGKPELAREHLDRYRKLKAALPPAERDAQ